MTDRPPRRRRTTGVRPTMHDVARLAGVSQTTVSFVLNGRDDSGISDDTKARIHDAVRKLGYRPNAMAQALRSGTSKLIGLITDEIAITPYAVEIIKGIQDTAREAGKLVVVLNAGDSPQDLEEAAGVLVEHQVDGVILATMYHREIDVPHVLRDVPVVLANCFSSSEVPSVVPDEHQGAFDATAHLIAHGHTQIAFLNNADDVPATRMRLNGYQAALIAHGLPVNDRLVVQGASDQDGGYAAAQTLFQNGDLHATALFCFNDRMAMGAYAALDEQGYRVPQHVSVVGFDNQATFAAHLRPGLSTMQLPHYEIGRWSATRLLSGNMQPERARLNCPLIDRYSVGVVGTAKHPALGIAHSQR